MQLFRPCEQHLVRALATIRDQRVKDNVLLGHAHQVLHVIGLGRVPRIELLLHAKGHAVTCCRRAVDTFLSFQALARDVRGERTMPNNSGGGALPADDLATYTPESSLKSIASRIQPRPGLPAGSRPPRAAHRPAAARNPRRTLGCTRGHGRSLGMQSRNGCRRANTEP